VGPVAAMPDVAEGSQHGAASVGEDVARHASEQEPLEGAGAPRTHNDDVRAVILSRGKDLVRG